MSKYLKIAILDDYQKASSYYSCVEKLSEIGDLFVFRDTVASEKELANRLKCINIILAIRERTKFSADLLAKLPELKFISQTGASANNIDLEAAAKLGILVSATSSHPRGAVEVTWGLILAVAHNIPAVDRAMRAGRWQTTLGTLLHGKTLGILGLGRIGKEVANIAQAFGIKVIAWGPTLTRERAMETGVDLASMTQVLRKSDILSVHLRLSEQSRGIIGWEELKLMKQSACLINTARGAIIDELALIKALETGIIAGAGLDVFQDEPINPDNPLLKMDNVVLTPHIGYVNYETFAHYFNEAVENILNFVSGNPSNVINSA